MENFDYKIKEKVDSFEYSELPGESVMQKMFEKLDSRRKTDNLDTEISDTVKVIRISPVFYRYAASIVVLISVIYIVSWLSEVSMVVPNGNHLTHELPDGSTIELNAGSRINYNKIGWMFHRNISFEGEGFFNVKAGRKFTVSSDKGITQVLGTSFNIFSRGQDYFVECISGRVKVSYKGNSNNNILTAGKGVKYGDSGDGIIFTFDLDNRNNWRNGEFYFDNESLNKVMEELSRQFDINIRLEEKIEHLKYSGYFNNKDLENALKMICEPLELKYRIGQDSIAIKSK